MIPMLGGIAIYTSEFVGDPVTPEPPAKLFEYSGPYKQRRLKRWRRAHPMYYRPNGTLLTIEEGPRVRVICHPADEPRLREALRQVITHGGKYWASLQS